MRAILRGMTVWGALAFSLVLPPAIASAQNVAEPPPASAPAPDTVGPRELQNFSLPGTTTRPTEQQTPPAATAPHPAPKAIPQRRQAEQPTRAATSPAPESVSPPAASPAPAARAPAPPVDRPAAPSFDLAAPSVAPPTSATSSTTPPSAAPTLTPEHGTAFLPWLLAALALGAGAAVILWRRRPRAAFAGRSEFDLFAAPEPAPKPDSQAPAVPPPAPRAAPQPRVSVRPMPAAPKPAAPVGVVATGLRPSLEINVEPLRCLVDGDRVMIEFAIDLLNTGTAPARAVLAEASLLNAGGVQERELAAFFANPVGAGERLDAIPPLGRVQLTSYVAAPRSAVQEYELAGRKAFVPVIALNALYEWSGRKAQASAAYLVGRATRGDKLGPLHLDSGTGEIRGLAARVLPAAVRT